MHMKSSISKESASVEIAVPCLMDDLQEKVIAENGKFNGERKVDKCNVDLKGCNF